MPATAQSTSFTLPRGSSVIFELGGIGTATVDPSRISNVYRIGTQEAFLGPYDRSLTIFVSVESGTINYRIDADGDLSDQSPAIAALGAEVDGLLGKSISLAAWARNVDMLISGAITRDANGAATSAPVIWPDGAAGVYSATGLSATFPGAVDAYAVTYVADGVSLTVTQPAVTRDASGAVTVRPNITVS